MSERDESSRETVLDFDRRDTCRYAKKAAVSNRTSSEAMSARSPFIKPRIRPEVLIFLLVSVPRVESQFWTASRSKSGLSALPATGEGKSPCLRRQLLTVERPTPASSAMPEGETCCVCSLVMSSFILGCASGAAGLLP